MIIGSRRQRKATEGKRQPTAMGSIMRNSENLRLASSVARPTLASVFLLMMPLTILGQSSGGAIRGTITDPSGAVIQGATVTLVQGGTGETRRLASNSAGLYDAPNLPIGTYALTVAASGFSTGKRTGIEVLVGSERVIDVGLTVGAAEQTVTATAEGAAVDSATSETGAVETGRVERTAVK